MTFTRIFSERGSESKRNQCRFLKKSHRFGLRLFRRIDDSALQAVKQRAWCDVDHHHLIRLLKDPVRHCLAYTQPSDLQDLVAKACQILHIHCSENVHGSVEQRLNILPSPLALRTGCIRMRQIIHNAHFWATLQDAGHINLLGVAAAARHPEQWHHFKFLRALNQITTTLRLKKREDDVHTSRFWLPPSV